MITIRGLVVKKINKNDKKITNTQSSTLRDLLMVCPQNVLLLPQSKLKST